MVDYWNTNIEENPHCRHGIVIYFPSRRQFEIFMHMINFVRTCTCTLQGRLCYSRGKVARQTNSTRVLRTAIVKSARFIDDYRRMSGIEK